MWMTWKYIKEILSDANKIALSSVVFHIAEKEIDDFTKRAQFKIKAKRIASTISLSTHDIVKNDRYLIGLSVEDRLTVFNQYQAELKQPMAFLESVSVLPEKNNQHIIKILLIEENKIICGVASDFLKDQKILSMLGPNDVVAISKIYMLEKMNHEDHFNFPDQNNNNLRYLK